MAKIVCHNISTRTCSNWKNSVKKNQSEQGGHHNYQRLTRDEHGHFASLRLQCHNMSSITPLPFCSIAQVSTETLHRFVGGHEKFLAVQHGRSPHNKMFYCACTARVWRSTAVFRRCWVQHCCVFPTHFAASSSSVCNEGTRLSLSRTITYNSI